MSATPLPSAITKNVFIDCRSRYESIIEALSASQSLPAAGHHRSLDQLDRWRRSELPAKIIARNPPHLTKQELCDLLQCKLKRGKFRPLKTLVESNDAKTIEKATSAGLSKLLTSSTQKDLLAALKEVSTLRGVGPATASYVLAAFRPSDVPVFSDEGYRWSIYENKPGRGWDRKLKYNAKEYAEYLSRTKTIAERLGVTTEQVEQVGFVLGREAVSRSASVNKTALETDKAEEEVSTTRKRARDSAGTKEEAVPQKRAAVNEPKHRNTETSPSRRILRSRSSKQVRRS